MQAERERRDRVNSLRDASVEKKRKEITEEDGFTDGLNAIASYLIKISKGEIENDELLDLLQDKARLKYTLTLTDPVAKAIQDAIEEWANEYFK